MSAMAVFLVERAIAWEMWQQFVRESYMKLKLAVLLTTTENERADILTKAMPKDDGNFKLFRNLLMNI